METVVWRLALAALSNVVGLLPLAVGIVPESLQNRMNTRWGLRLRQRCGKLIECHTGIKRAVANGSRAKVNEYRKSVGTQNPVQLIVGYGHLDRPEGVGDNFVGIVIKNHIGISRTNIGGQEKPANSSIKPKRNSARKYFTQKSGGRQRFVYRANLIEYTTTSLKNERLTGSINLTNL